MTKKQRQFFGIGIFFIIFLSVGFFYLSATKAFAADLEVNYPKIAGQTIDSKTELPQYVKYLFNIGMFVGFFAVFISLIIAGATYILSPVSVELRSSARDRASGAISGLLILALTYLIIITINPQLSLLNYKNSSQTSLPSPQKKAPGVYFFNKSECSDGNMQSDTSSIQDLGELKNKINSVSIVQDSDNQIGYISILYDSVGLQGKCQYIDPNQDCQSVDPFAASASINQFDSDPNGDGVYFYRKSYFNDKGGSFKVDNSEIKNIYVKSLEDLKFQDVPKEEQDCIKYDANGECNKDGRQAPTLAGENISSIKIKGDYLVMLVYRSPEDDSSGPWSYCQEFPTAEDLNKTGPQQIKWQNIRNIGSLIPNYLVIIPIKR